MVRQFETGAALAKTQHAGEASGASGARRDEEDASLVVKDDCQDVPSGCSVIEQSLCGSISAPVSRCHRCESAMAAHFEIVNGPPPFIGRERPEGNIL